ncbi:hypothetical protein FE633_13400 [Streptomyces montanus]|uniref:Uncharacterized protein n=1 Tax=Streptomyces montanus TaxID=2580423 RepID=A0A5R9FY67_9ACTN|nr:hypothetical protein [Streptomyces montanus]TLS45753.1 hypothetical protein FE633_13400 [Streptomyces montanus]
MSAPEMPVGCVPQPGTLRYTPIATPSAWAFERDRRFAVFLAARLTEAEDLGCCHAELKVLAGVRDVFEEWLANRELAMKLADHDLAMKVDDDLFTGSISALGWTLRCLARTVWSSHPGWELAFHPNVVSAPIDPLKASVSANAHSHSSTPGFGNDRRGPES